MATVYRLLKKKQVSLADPTSSFENQTIIITGSNVGLGYEAAKKFIRLGASRLIMAVRSVDKGNAAKARIEQDTGITGRIEVWPLDMSSYDSIKAFAEKASTHLDRIDVALLNAGVHNRYYEQSPYGWEGTLQVNTLSTILLALLLIPKLKSSKTSKHTAILEITSSGRHTEPKIDPKLYDEPNLLQWYSKKEHFHGDTLYAISKFLLQLCINELAKQALNQYDEPEVVITSVCPGFCNSDLARDYSGLVMGTVRAFVFSFARTAEEGSRTLVSGSTLGLDSHGKFWQHDEFRP
jgi:NAD(P)-dependent dehydrogenase (short-subunit alcohol dehydrogenase family)